MPQPSSANEKKLVLLNSNVSPPKFDLLTQTEYDALPENIRTSRLQATLDYLRKIPGIPQSLFTKSDGSPIQFISEADLSGAISLIHQKLPPVISLGAVPRMPTEIVIHWISELQNGLNKLEEEHAVITRKRNSSTDEVMQKMLLDWKITVVKSILAKQKSNWLSHNLTVKAVAESLKRDSEELYKVDLKDLADLAYRADERACLYIQLPRTDVFENYQTRLNDNVYGRVFETNLMHGLVENPPPQLYNIMTSIARGLDAMFDELPLDIVTNKLVVHLENSIKNHQRPWFSQVSQLKNFLNPDIDNSDKLAVLRAFLKSPVTDGYQIIAITYLVQHLYIVRSTFKHLLSLEDVQWLYTTNLIYNEVHSIKENATTSTRIKPLLLRSLTDKDVFKPILGITNSYQPAAVPPMGQEGPVDRPGVTKSINIHSADTPQEIHDALLYGLPNVTGISGTTNIFLGTLTHLITDLGYDIDVAGAFLGLLMFLILDGGHSIHEALLMVNHRESLPSTRKYARLGFKPFNVTRESVQRKGIFVSDYEKFLAQYRDTSMWPAIEMAHNTAWESTIDYFNQHSAYRNGIEQTITPVNPTLERLFSRFEQVMQVYPSAQNKWQFVAVELEKLLQQRMESPEHPVSRSVAIKEFIMAVTREEFNIKNYPHTVKDIMVSVLIDLGGKELAKKTLWDTLKTLPRFKSLKEEQVFRLVIDSMQYKEERHTTVKEVGYMAGMLFAYKKMLKDLASKFSIGELLSFHDTAVFKISKEGEFRDPIEENFRAALLLDSDCPKFLTRGLYLKNSEYSLTVGNLAKKQNGNASSQGVKELLQEIQFEEHPFIQLMDYKLNAQREPIPDQHGKIATLIIKKNGSEKALKGYVNKLIKQYHDEIKNKNEAGKLTAIAKLCRGLAVLKLFKHHDKAVIGIVVLNKLLLQNELAPTILENIEHLAAFSIKEIVTKIQQGQVTLFQLVQRKDSTGSVSSSDLLNKKNETQKVHENKVTGTNAKRPPPLIIPDEKSSTSLSPSHISEPESADSVYFEGKYRLLESSLFDQASEEFNHGYSLKHYQDIAIPKFDKNMSVMEMQALALAQADKQTPNLRVLGALVRRIMLAQTKGIDQTQVLKTLIDVSKASQDLKASYERAISQVIYTQAVDPGSQGLCYGLTWAVATMLEKGGEEAVDRFAQRMHEAAEYPNARSSVLMQTVLKSLHDSANNLYRQTQQETRAFPHYSLDEIIDELEQVRGAAMYEFNTPQHAMMLGVIGGKLKRQFYIYDPNTLIAGYASSAALKKALHDYLTPARLAEYSSFNRIDGKRVFEFKKINTDVLSGYQINVEGNNYLTIADIANKQSLHTILAQRQAQKVQEAQVIRDASIENLARNTSFHLSLNELDHQKIAKNLLRRTQDIYDKNSLSVELIPLFSKMEKSERGYRLPFFNRNDTTAEIKWIDTQDVKLFNLKESIEICTKQINESYTLQEDFLLRKKADAMLEMGAKSLNAAFLSHTLLNWKKWDDRNTAVNGEVASNLSTAINIHAWVSLSQMTQGVVHDATEIVQLVRTLIANSKNIDLSFSSTLKTFGYGVQGAGVFLGGIVVGLDLYEYAHAENPIQENVFGTQATFDSVSLAMSLAGIGFGLAGFSTIAGVLGPLSVPFMGIGIGASGLAQVYGEMAEETKSVGAYFAAVDKAYQTGYQRHDDGYLVFPSGSVIQSIDLNTGVITYGSQYLYTYNYHYISALDSPNDNDDRSQAIAIRPALGYAESFTINQQDRNVGVLFLPSTVASYDSTYTQIALGFRHTQTEGDAVLAKLEKACNERFKMEYGFFFQHTVRNMTHQYIPTRVRIVLDSRQRTLLAPQLPQQIASNDSNVQYLHPRANAMTYQLDGQGGQYTLVLNKGATFILNAIGTAASEWVLDTRYLENDEVIFKTEVNGTKALVINGVSIIFASLNQEKVSVIKKNGTICAVDFANKQLLVSSIDASQWEISHTQKIQAHLLELEKFHQLAGRYTLINHYQYQDKGINIDRAYYDSKQDRMIFSYIDRSADLAIKPLVALIDELLQAELVTASKETTTCINQIDAQGNARQSQRPPLEESVSIHLQHAHKWRELLVGLKAKSLIPIEQFNSFVSELNKWVQLKNKKHIITAQDQCEALAFDEAKKTLKEQFESVMSENEWNDLELVNATTTKRVAISFDEAKRLLKLTSSPSDLMNQLKSLRQALLYPYQDTQDAQLVGVVGDDVYFYDKTKKLLWRADATTHIVTAQFVNPVKHFGRRFWMEGDALYMACRSFIYGDNEPCEYVYRIDKHKMTLVSVLFEPRQGTQISLIEDLSELKAFGTSVKLLLPKPVLQPTALANNIPIIDVTYAEFTPLSGKDKSGAQQCYWIMPRGKIIKPNLPESVDSNTNQQLERIPDDLILAMHMLDSTQQEIFYFYSQSRKVLYRQVGAGVLTYFSDSEPFPNTSRQAKRVVIPHLLDILASQDRLFAITQEGLIYQVDEAGKITVSAVNQTWLSQHLTNWSTDLVRLNDKQPILTLVGFKVNDKTPLPAWYYRGKIAMTMVASMTLNFLDSDQEGRYVRLFDPVSGKLYKQAVVDQTILNTAFDSTLTLKTSQSIPTAEELFPKAKLSSVTVLDNKLRLITDEGLIFSLDWAGEIRLIGLTQTWLNTHPGEERTNAIEQLLKFWQHDGVLVFQNSSIPTWFDVDTRSTIIAWGLEAKDAPELVGIGLGNKEAYVWSANKGLYRYDLIDGATKQTPYSLNNNGVRRFNNTLRIVGGKDEDVLQPFWLKGVNTIVMSGGPEKDVYQIDMQDLSPNKKFLIDSDDASPVEDKVQLEVDNIDDVSALQQTILIDNYDVDHVEDELQLEVDNIDDVSASRYKNDLFLQISQRVIVIRNVFHQARDDYRHLTIKLNEHVLKLNDSFGYLETTVSEIASRIENQTQSLMNYSNMMSNEGVEAMSVPLTNLNTAELSSSVTQP